MTMPTPLTIRDVGGCTCQGIDPDTGQHVYGGVQCRYHEGAAEQPWNHRIPWNCPTYWDGCNCEGGPYFYAGPVSSSLDEADQHPVPSTDTPPGDEQ